MNKLKLVTALLFTACCGAVFAGKHLEGIACRSIHLGYRQIFEADEVEITLIPEESHEGTYFCALGFDMGYLGMQEQSNGKKVLIFSVWEPGKAQNPNEVPQNIRVKLIEKGEGVRIGRFGWEGTGGQSFYDIDWQLEKPVRFKVSAKPEGKKTTFTGWFYNEEKKKWQMIASFQTLTGGIKVRGVYSFVEDFKRNRISLTKRRSCRFGKVDYVNNGTRKTANEAIFSGDGNPATNINAGTRKGFFFLETGGKTENKDTRLWQKIKLPAATQPPKE